LILVDTAVWADHFGKSDDHLVLLLDQGLVTIHPFVIAELALGNLRNWKDTVAMLESLPQASLADQAELLAFIQIEQLQGSGIGLVDTHLLASCRLDLGTRLWTRDKRLRASAEKLGVAWNDA
jgi:predicted nucleic acid-binding protein